MRLAICRTALVLANAVLLGYAVGLVALMVHQWAVGSARLDVQPHAVTAPALRHHLLPIVHGQPQLLDSAQAYVIVSLVTALLALVASVAGFVAISKRRGRLLVIALIATTAALLALQIIVTTVAVAQRPAGQVQQREVDGALRGMWTDAWTVDRRAAYQRAHACCGFWNASDVAVVDDRYCFDEGRVALPRDGCVSALREDESRRWLLLYLFFFVPMAMVLSELFMYYWLYRLYRAWELDVFRDRTFGVDVVASGSAANRYRPLAGWDDLYYEADEEDDK